MPNPVVHFEVMGTNAAELQKFYADAFDWKVDANNPMNYGMVDNSGEGINGGISQPMHGGPYATFYVQVDDLQKALDKIESLGGKTVAPPMEIPNVVTFAQFSDPHGNLIGLVQGGGPEAPGVSSGNNPPVAWFEILGSNTSELFDFYSKAFDWKIKETEGAGIEYGEVETGSDRGIPGGIGSNRQTQNIVTVYALVDDLNKYLAKANELGAKTVIEPQKAGERTTIANFQDPQGNIFGLFTLTTG